MTIKAIQAKSLVYSTTIYPKSKFVLSLKISFLKCFSVIVLQLKINIAGMREYLAWSPSVDFLDLDLTASRCASLPPLNDFCYIVCGFGSTPDMGDSVVEWDRNTEVMTFIPAMLVGFVWCYRQDVNLCWERCGADSETWVYALTVHFLLQSS